MKYLILLKLELIPYQVLFDQQPNIGESPDKSKFIKKWFGVENNQHIKLLLMDSIIYCCCSFKQKIKKDMAYLTGPLRTFLSHKFEKDILNHHAPQIYLGVGSSDEIFPFNWFMKNIL